MSDKEYYSESVNLQTFETVFEPNIDLYTLIYNKGDWLRGNETDVDWGKGHKDAYVYRTVYGITVADTHNYFVGNGGYWVKSSV